MYLNLFVGHLDNNNFSTRTKRDYTREIKRFFDFLTDANVTDIEGLKPLHIDLYINGMIQKGNTSVTREKKVYTLRTFFNFMYTRDYISKNPMDKIDRIKTKDADKKPHEVLTDTESVKLMTTIEQYATDKEKSRLLILIMLKCGLRVDEVRNLKKEDINIKKRTVTVINGKGGKNRVVPLFNEMVNDMKSLLKGKKDEDFVFLNRHGNQMSERGIYGFVVRYVKKAKIKKDITCHGLRRTCATELIRNGASITSVQRFLGHSSISTTQIYVRQTEEEILDEIRTKSKNISKRVLKDTTKKKKENS